MTTDQPDNANQGDNVNPAEDLPQTDVAGPPSPPSSLGRLLRTVVITLFLCVLVLIVVIGNEFREPLGKFFGLSRKMSAAEKQALADIEKFKPHRAEHFDKDPERPIWDIDLNKTSITDEGMEPLSQFGSLEILSLHDTEIGDAGLAHISGLTSLTFLHLANTKVTDKGIKHLRRLTRLHSLYLLGTKLTDAGLAYLKPLTSLRVLRINDTAVTDDGLVYLQPLQNLKTLILSGTKVTDAGLKHLEGIPSLRLVLVRRTAVTEEGAKDLEGKITGLKVEIE